MKIKEMDKVFLLRNTLWTGIVKAIHDQRAEVAWLMGTGFTSMESIEELGLIEKSDKGVKMKSKAQEYMDRHKEWKNKKEPNPPSTKGFFVGEDGELVIQTEVGVWPRIPFSEVLKLRDFITDTYDVSGDSEQALLEWEASMRGYTK